MPGKQLSVASVQNLEGIFPIFCEKVAFLKTFVLHQTSPLQCSKPSSCTGLLCCIILKVYPTPEFCVALFKFLILHKLFHFAVLKDLELDPSAALLERVIVKYHHTRQCQAISHPKIWPKLPLKWNNQTYRLPIARRKT